MASRVLALLASPRLALGVLGFLALYGASTVSLRDTRLAVLIGSNPFGSPPFLLACALLFASTLACTWLRSLKVAALWAGRLPESKIEIEASDPELVRRFLSLQGFRGDGPLRRRYRLALWGGWVLHLSLLLLMAGVLVQLAFHDGGAFELVEGETVRLSDPGVVFGREHGALAPSNPPDVRVSLHAFDPYQHQAGYAPDRLSRLRVELPSGTVQDVVLDRAEGVKIGGVSFYQAIPSGLALVLDTGEASLRSIHLRTEAARRATAEVTDPLGRSVRFEVESEQDLDSRRGTGVVTITVTGEAHSRNLKPGEHFDFGRSGARLIGVARWSGHTYAQSPGMPAVFCGFALVLAASLLLAFPAGMALIEEPRAGCTRASIWVNRGREVMRLDWERFRESGCDS